LAFDGNGGCKQCDRWQLYRQFAIQELRGGDAKNEGKQQPQMPIW
jgi:hypothetical protein